MYVENYNIHNLVKFQIVNRNLPSLLEKYNPEYEYFRIDSNVIPDFRIILTRNIENCNNGNKVQHRFSKCYDKWSVVINEYENGFVDLLIRPKLNGVSKYISYFCLKNLYIRSLVYYSLLKKGITLLHASGVCYKCDGYLFVGKSGVFKTSILMDILRNFNSKFLGEENVLIHNGCVYPYPFHLKSLNYRLKNYDSENAKTLLQKLLQVYSVIMSNNNNMLSYELSDICYIGSMYFIEKGESFSINNSSLDDLIPDLTSNELIELDVKCNPRWSAGIQNNHFSDYINFIEANEFIKHQLSNVIKTSLSGAKIFKVTVPSTYNESYIHELMEV